MSDAGARGGGGALATFNRSIGPFQANRTEVTFLRAVVIVDPAATGKAGTAGVYRSPFSLPNGEILASYAANVTNPARTRRSSTWSRSTSAPGRAARWPATASLSYVEAALGYKRAETMLFSNMPQLVFGGRIGARARTTAIMHLPGRAHAGDAAGLRTCAAAATSPTMDRAVGAQGLRGAAALPAPTRAA